MALATGEINNRQVIAQLTLLLIMITSWSWIYFWVNDICLQQHVNTWIENSKKQNETGAKVALFTLLSNETFNNVADVISQLIKVTIAEEVRQAVMFSVQINPMQDISSKDQCSIILRYVIQEKLLIAVVNCETQKCYWTLILTLAHVWATQQMVLLICRDSLGVFLNSSLNISPISFIFGVTHIFLSCTSRHNG